MDIIGNLLKNNVSPGRYLGVVWADGIAALEDGISMECASLQEAAYLFYCLTHAIAEPFVIEYYDGCCLSQGTEMRLLTGTYTEYKEVRNFAKQVYHGFKPSLEGRGVEPHGIDVRSIYTWLKSSGTNEEVATDILNKVPEMFCPNNRTGDIVTDALYAARAFIDIMG